MATVVYNIYLSRKNGGDLRLGETAPGINLVRDSGGSGHIRALLLCKVQSPGDDQLPSHDTVAACIAQSGYSEYQTSTGYPDKASRPLAPQFTVTQNDAQNRAECTAPTPPSGQLSFGNPDENVVGGNPTPVRYILFYEHFDDSDDSLNVPCFAIDEGTIIGTNGSSALLPMNFSWGSRVCDFVKG